VRSTKPFSPLQSKKPVKVRNLPRLPPAPLVRAFLLGALGIVACVWALVRHFTHPRLPMLVPVPTAAPSDSSEVPAPDTVPAE